MKKCFVLSRCRSSSPRDVGNKVRSCLSTVVDVQIIPMPQLTSSWTQSQRRLLAATPDARTKRLKGVYAELSRSPLFLNAGTFMLSTTWNLVNSFEFFKPTANRRLSMLSWYRARRPPRGTVLSDLLIAMPCITSLDPFLLSSVQSDARRNLVASDSLLHEQGHSLNIGRV